MLLILVTIFAAVSIHRLYNYENIFEPIRTRLRTWWKPLSCPACNAFWIGAAVTLGAWFGPVEVITPLFAAIALYAPLRAAVWLYGFFGIIATAISTWQHTTRRGPRTPAQPLPTKPKPPEPVRPAAETVGCSTCGSKTKGDLDKLQNYTKRIVIMTALGDLAPSYSLTSVILDQARMLGARTDWAIQVWVMQTANIDNWPAMPPNVEVRKIIPVVPWVEDGVDAKSVDIIKEAVTRELIPLGNATIITHDLLFVSWFTTFAAAIHEIGPLKGFSWFHVAHSGPTAASSRPAPNTPRWYRQTLPSGRHFAVVLAPSQHEGFQRHYNTTAVRVRIWPNPRDLRTMDLHPDAVRVIDAAQPHLADIAQLYPVSTTRFEGKGLSKLIAVFAKLYKEHNKTVCLIIANPHANGPKGDKIIADTKQMIQRAGLPPSAVVFTSECVPGSAVRGLSVRAIRELFSVTNIFAFPTLAEANSLILMEAALAGVPLVLNRAVSSLGDVIPDEAAAWVDWDSKADIDHVILTLTRRDARRHVLRQRSLETIGHTVIADIEATALLPI